MSDEIYSVFNQCLILYCVPVLNAKREKSKNNLNGLILEFSRKKVLTKTLKNVLILAPNEKGDEKKVKIIACCKNRIVIPLKNNMEN